MLWPQFEGCRETVLTEIVPFWHGVQNDPIGIILDETLSMSECDITVCGRLERAPATVLSRIVEGREKRCGPVPKPEFYLWLGFPL